MSNVKLFFSISFKDRSFFFFIVIIFIFANISFILNVRIICRFFLILVAGTQAYVSGSKCLCCPYGYHIDLDFVRYCEAVAAGSTGDRSSIERRKKRERRRQCQSMEVLLGLVIKIIPSNLSIDRSIDFLDPSKSVLSTESRSSDLKKK